MIYMTFQAYPVVDKNRTFDILNSSNTHIHKLCCSQQSWKTCKYINCFFFCHFPTFRESLYFKGYEIFPMNTFVVLYPNYPGFKPRSFEHISFFLLSNDLMLDICFICLISTHDERKKLPLTGIYA